MKKNSIDGIRSSSTIQDVIKDLSKVINSHSLEDISDTPDKILGGFLYGCLRAFNSAHIEKKMWFDDKLKDSVRYVGQIESVHVEKDKHQCGVSHVGITASDFTKTFFPDPDNIGTVRSEEYDISIFKLDPKKKYKLIIQEV